MKQFDVIVVGQADLYAVGDCAHILGHGAGDMINLIALAMEGGLPASRLKEMMWAYPTLSSDTKYMV